MTFSLRLYEVFRIFMNFNQLNRFDNKRQPTDRLALECGSFERKGTRRLIFFRRVFVGPCLTIGRLSEGDPAQP